MTSATAPTPRKFNFDTVFDTSGRVTRNGQGVRLHYLPEEVEQIRKKAFEEGRQAELVKAEQSAAQAIQGLTALLQALVPAIDREIAQIQRESAEAILAAARAIAGAALDAIPEPAILVAVDEALRTLRDTPFLALRLAPAQSDALGPRILAAAEGAGFAGRVRIESDPRARAGDWRLEWTGGAIAFDRAEAFARIQDAAERSIGAAMNIPNAPEPAELTHAQ